MIVAKSVNVFELGPWVAIPRGYEIDIYLDENEHELNEHLQSFKKERKDYGSWTLSCCNAVLIAN